MNYVTVFLKDVFSGAFDLIMPVSGCLIAIGLGIVFFFIRFNAYHYNRKKRDKESRGE